MSEKIQNVEPSKKTQADWDTEYINNLSDEAFAYIEEGGTKDEQGKTTPRNLRHLPFKNAQGEIDHDHLVAALQAVKGARQGEAPPYADKAKPKLCAAVKTYNESHQDNPIQSEVCDVQQVQTASKPFKPYREKFAASFNAAKNKTAQMNVDQIKARIAELSKQREDLWDKMYPPPEQLVSEEERINLQSQLDVISAEIEALEIALAEKIATEPSGQPATVVAAVKPVDNEPPMVTVTEQEITNVLTDRRRFTPALQVNGILDLLEQKKREIQVGS